MDTKMLWPVLGTYITLSLLAFAAYAIDKAAARKGEWRISENTLHLLDCWAAGPVDGLHRNSCDINQANDRSSEFTGLR